MAAPTLALEKKKSDYESFRSLPFPTTPLWSLHIIKKMRQQPSHNDWKNCFAKLQEVQLRRKNVCLVFQAVPAVMRIPLTYV